MKIPITIDKGLVRFVKSEIFREVGSLSTYVGTKKKHSTVEFFFCYVKH